MYFRDFINHHRTGNLFVDPTDNPTGQTKDGQLFKLRIPKKNKTITRSLISSTIKRILFWLCSFLNNKIYQSSFLEGNTEWPQRPNLIGHSPVTPKVLALMHHYLSEVSFITLPVRLRQDLVLDPSATLGLLALPRDKDEQMQYV